MTDLVLLADRPLPESVLHALAAAPARIKRLRCEQLGWDGSEAVLALLERAKGHLEEFSICNSYFHVLRDQDVRRLWGILVGSNVSNLSVATELLCDVGFVLEVS